MQGLHKHGIARLSHPALTVALLHQVLHQVVQTVKGTLQQLQFLLVQILLLLVQPDQLRLDAHYDSNVRMQVLFNDLLFLILLQHVTA